MEGLRIFVSTIMPRMDINIINILRRIYNKFHTNIWQCRIRLIKGLAIGPRIRIIGSPIIDIRNGGKIVIGDNVTLNSINYGYHAGMHGPVKLFADRPGAIIHIGENTRIHGSCIHAYTSITIGKNCLIAANCQILDCNGHDISFDEVDRRVNTTGPSRSVTIEDSVWIGLNSIILPGVRIGRGSIIGAGSIVTKDIPPMVVAAGSPAHVIRCASPTEMLACIGSHHS